MLISFVKKLSLQKDLCIMATRSEIKKQQSELISLMLKKAGLTENDIYQSAIRSWVNKNIDLLTATEKKRFKSVLM